MADSIDLTGGQGELERMKADNQQVPPPAALPPGVASGNPPLPVGRAVRAIDPKHLTPLERTKLEAIGWKEGEPVPSDMAETIAAFEQRGRAETQGDLPLPADPATPPIQFEPQNIEDMPANERAGAQRMMDESLAAAAGQIADDRQQAAASRSHIAQAQPSVQMDTAPPERPATQSVPNTVPGAAASPTPAATPQTPQPATPEIPEPEAAAEPDYGTPAQAHCQHCGWDLSSETIPDPGADDKLSFLQSVLGHQAFQKRYTLLNGKFVVGFRTLTAQEIDVVYKQVFKERENGEILTDIDYWERINRYRLYLQIAYVKTEKTLAEFPDGLSKETSPHCTGTWKVPDGADALKAIEQHMLSNVLATETLSRIVQNTCGQFNRLIAKLEARVENPDFWKEIEQQA